jgi:hypothetical protein
MSKYIDEGALGGTKVYMRKSSALKAIRETLSEDLELLRNGETMENITEDRLLEIGYQFYSIYEL